MPKETLVNKFLSRLRKDGPYRTLSKTLDRLMFYFSGPDARIARLRLLKSRSLSSDEIRLLERASLNLNVHDSMYVRFEARHYLEVGLSAIRCVNAAIEGAGEIERVLDLPCGYGRVLRFLKQRFPNATITACELNREALDFCAASFSVETAFSNPDPSRIPLTGEFDLIWCGSLLTHFDEPRAEAILRFFYDHLSPNGVCVFSAHGDLSADWLENDLEHYGLPQSARNTILRAYRDTGFGYADYPGQSYGISIISRQKVHAICSRVGNWHERLFMHHGWARHQDVYGYTKRNLPGKVVIPSERPKKVPGKWERAL